MLRLHSPSEANYQAWEQFLRDHPQNSVFQSPEMHFFYSGVKKFHSVPLLVEEDGRIIGVLLAVIIREHIGPLGFLSARAVVYGGPVMVLEKVKRLKALDMLLGALVKKVGKSTMFIQFRNSFSWNEDEIAVFERHGFTMRDRINLLIDTDSRKQMLAGMKENRKRQILKGLKQGDEVRSPKNVSEVRALYFLLADLYANKVRKPFPQWSFFEKFYQYSQQGKLGIIRVVVNKGRVIGGIISPVTPDKTIFEWYVVGLDKEYPGHYPSVVATWSAMAYAAENKLKQFDLMGLGKPDEPYGVRDFKLRFGGEVVNYGRFGRRNYTTLYNLAEFGYNLLRHMRKV